MLHAVVGFVVSSCRFVGEADADGTAVCGSSALPFNNHNVLVSAVASSNMPT